MKRRCFRPTLESLEVRTVPTTITFHSGTLLTNVQVTPVFYGTYWSTPTGQQQVANLDAYLAYLTNSPYMDLLAEYSVGHGSLSDNGIVDTSISGPSTAGDSRIRTMLSTHINNGSIDAPNAQRLYIVYTPPDVVVRANGQNSLRDFAGYHDSFTVNGAAVNYAVVVSPVGNGDLPSLTDFQTLTEVSSHELAESVTDPAGTGWYDTSSGDEIADVADGRDGTLNGYVVTSLWSQQRQALELPTGAGSIAQAVPPGLGEVSNALTHSPEAYQLFITSAYQKYLGRSPDTTGLAFWVNQMQNGLTDEQIEASFLGAPEYIQDHGGTYAGWVTGMYQNLLGRAPTTAEVSYWVGQLSAGKSTSSVALGFAASAEREGQRVAADYTTYLGRTATSSEINYWVGQFEAGFTNEDLVANFVGSTEYYLNTAKGKGSPTSWLTSAYSDVLHRAPTPDEASSWLPVLDD